MTGQLSKCRMCAREVECSDILMPIFSSICNECTILFDALTGALRQARIDGNHYTVDSWRTDNERDNLEHALTHIFKHKRQDTTEDHIAHAICDLVMEYAKVK